MPKYLSPSMPWEGESGWMLMVWIRGLNPLRRRAAPMKVPLVPTPAIKCVIRPADCCQISTPVVR
jgi:hypothetical protein